jgi:hypothetical protein
VIKIIRRFCHAQARNLSFSVRENQGEMVDCLNLEYSDPHTNGNGNCQRALNEITRIQLEDAQLLRRVSKSDIPIFGRSGSSRPGM